VAGSKDSSNWILLSSQVGIGTSAYAPSNIYSIYNFTSYNYYRLIVTKTISDTTLSIADISLGGNTNTSFTPLDNYNILLYNTNEKQFPPRPWDNIDTTNEYSSSNELFNVTPASYFKQVLTYNNHGTYTIYSSSSIIGSVWSKHLLFNYNLSDLEGATWLANNYSGSTGNYTNTTTNATIGLNNNYRGDWIIVKFPFAIVLTKFIIYGRTTLLSRAPGLWKCYGSNDGVNWTEITDAASPSTGATYTGVIYQQTLPSYFDIPYLYIGWVISKLAIPDIHGTLLNFIELQIFGKDDISNSYLNVWNKSNTSIFNTLGNVGIGTTNPIQRLSVIGNTYLSGNVGIGTTNPTNTLSVIGNANIVTSSVNNVILELSDGTNRTKIGGNGGGAHHITSTNTFVFNTALSAGGVAIFRNLNTNYDTLTNYTDRMTIHSTGVDINQSLTVGTTSRLIGNVGIGTTPSQQLHLHGGALYITGNSTISGDTGSASFWNLSGVGPTIAGFNVTFRTNGSTERMRITSAGNVGIGITNPRSRLEVIGACAINNGNSYAIANNFVAAGALCIGDTNTDYGGSTGGWVANTAGLIMECSNNTEIAIHDNASRVASFMQYVGTSNQFIIGRNMGWDEIARINLIGNVGIGTTIGATSKLCVNRNPLHNNGFDFTTSPCVITNLTPSSSNILNDPQPILHLCREGTSGLAFGQRLTFSLSRFEHDPSLFGSRTRCDIILAENAFANTNIMTLLSSGRVGIGTTSPKSTLELYSTSQTVPELILSGTDFSTNTTSPSGVAFLLGSNLTDNRQFWIADSSALGVGTTNPVIRIMPNTRTIDAVATNGTTALSLGIGNTGSSLFLNGNNIYGDASQLNNFKFENNNQSNLIYPPPIGTSTSLTHYFSPSASNMQAGTYIMSASSNNATAYFAFDKNLATDFSITSAYNVTTGNYNNSGANITSTFVSGTDIRGEWVQLYYDKGFVANSITISGIAASNAKCPKDFIVAGSKEGSNWILLSSQVGIMSYASSNTFTIYNFTSYNFYRLIVTKTITATDLSIADISFGGNPNTSFTPLDNYNILLYNTNEKQFPPRIWDIAPVAEVPSSNEIFNIIPLSYQRQQFSLNNHGTYTIYSSTTWNSTLGNSKANLFDYNLTETTEYGATWKPDNYANGVLAAVANTYTIGLNNSYRGDWIIVKFPFPIILTRFRFYRRNDIIDRSPGFWKCYGSNDGVNWTEITEASHIPPSLSIATYTTTNDGSSYYYQKIVSNLDIPYLYIGWVVNQLAGTNVLANCINFSELQIFGKDDISNSYLNVWNKSNTSIFNTLGNVGIGTTNPTQRLTIVGNSYFNGNVGIGTTNPTQQLHLQSGALYITGSASITGDTASASFWNQSGVGPTIAGANIAFRTNGSTEVMRITSTGNVGIGTTNPESKLDIILPDNINITTNVLGFKNTANYGIYATSTSIENRGNTLDFLARDYNFALANITTRNILSLRPEGNVGIGITNPAQRLSVAGNSYISGNVGIGTTPSTTSGNMLRLHTTFAGANDQLLITGTSTIGVTNIRLSNGGTGVADAFIGLAGTAYGATGDLYRNNLYLQSPSSIVFNTQGNGSTTANMIIVGNGNVGIGTTNPGSYLLNVAGSLNATSFFSNTLPINFNSYATTTELAGKENTLTFSSPLTRTTNTIGINLSGYATTSNLASYLPLSGGTMTGALNFKTAIWNLSSDNQQRFYFDTNGTTFIQGQGTIPIAFRNNANADIAVITSTGVINAVLKLQEAGVDISTKYLSLAAATNDLSGKLAILNGNPLNTPQLGDYGGTGDRLILWKGNSGAYPYSLGMNGSTMWYSVPGGAIHNFYVNGVSKYQINSGGVAVFGNVSTQTLAVVDVTTYTNQYQLLISSPTSTTPARIQTIQQNMGYTQNLILQGENLSGNVGIGTLTNITSKLTVNGDITASATVTASSFIEGGQALSSKYLQSASLGNYVLKAGDTMTGALNITSTTTDNQLIITNTATNRFASIRFFNGTANGFIGVGCTAVGGTYQNNLFIEANNSIIFSSANATSATSPPRMILNNSGNLGINVASPIHKLHVQGASPAMIRIETNINAPGEISGIEFGIPAFSSVNSAKITSTAIAGDKANLQFFTTNGGASSTRMLINETGNVGIGTTNPNASLEVYSNVQLYPKVILSGTDFSTNTTSSSGVAFLLGSNLTNDRQLWIADSSAISVGTTNPVIRIMPNTRTIDAVATNGTTPLSLGIGNTGSSLFLNGNNIYGDASQLNNFKFENNNQSNLIYPPPIGTSTSLTHYFSPSASNMQSGTYIMSASSNSANAYLAFDRNLTTEFSISSPYISSSGNYSNAGANITSTFVSGTDIRGEWIQLNYNKGFVANSITISGITGSNAKCPKDFIIAGSKDSSNWILLSSQVGIGTYSPSNIISIYNFTSYNFYRLIVTKTISDPILSIADISFSGNPNTSFIPLDNYNILLYNTNEKQFPPRVWDVAPATEASSSNEIFNITPVSYLRQQFSLNNHGTYTIYSSSTSGSQFQKSALFNYDFGDSSGNNTAHWALNYTAGVLNPGIVNTIGLNNNYYGDWIVVKFPYQILLTRFRFYARNTNLNRAPGFWRCYGSNDGVNWAEITDASNSLPIAAIATYGASDANGNFFEKTVLNLDIPYLYIGWIVNRLSGSDAGATVMNFAEMQIFGKDDISNSYLNVWNKTNTSIFNTLGNVGIGTTNPTQRLTVVGNANISGTLTLSNMLIENFLFNNTGISHEASIRNFNDVTSFGYRHILDPTVNSPDTSTTSQKYYSWYIGLGSNFGADSYGAQFAIPRNLTNPTMSIRFKEGSTWYGWSAITAGFLKGNANFNVDTWQNSSDGTQRIFFGNNGTTFIKGHGTSPLIFRNSTDSNIITVTNTGNVGIGIGNTNPVSTLNVSGTANIHNGSSEGIARMQSGSLTIGGTNANYGGNFYTSGDWIGTNTAGLLMECSSNTEIVVHDAGTRLASLMYYEGVNNQIYIGRNMGWTAIAQTNILGNLNVVTGHVYINNSKLIFNATLNDYKIDLYSSVYGIGIRSATLAFFSQSFHSFFSSTTPTNPVVTINATNGDLNTVGRITTAGNVGIGTTNPTSKLSVVGDVNISENLTANKKIFYSSTLTSAPTIAINGGDGDRIILYTGSGTAYPHSLGININTMWYSVPANTVHNFYVNGTSRYEINSSGANLTGRLNITHSSTSANAENGGFYVYNPNTGAGNCSILGARINGNVANRCGISLDVSGYYGWNVGINGNDTTNRMLRFNASWDNLGVDRMTLDYNGNLTTSGNYDCGGGIAINGSTAFFGTGAVDAGNLINTYLNFKYAGSENDWCYIRQIGGSNSYKLALDFHDDGDDAEFCIRNIKSVDLTDTITEVFTVNNNNVGIGNSTPTAPLWIGNPGITGSAGSIVISQATDATTKRNFRMAYDNQYNFCFGDYDSANNNTNVFKSQLSISYLAPANCLTINGSGNVGIGITNPNFTLQVGTGTGSIYSSIIHLANGYPNGSYGVRLVGLDNQINGHNLNIQTRTDGGSFVNSVTVTSSGNMGIGTTSPKSMLELYSTSQTVPEIILSGTDFSTNTTSTSGVAFLLGSNLTDNRQFWIADSSAIGVGTTNPVIRIMPNTRTIDAVATNGTTPLSLGIGNTASSLFLNGNNIYGDASQLNNFKFENNNQSNLIYPPPIGTSTSLTRYFSPSASNMQAGTYIMSASSNNATAYLAFDKNLATEFTISSAYNVTTGNYNNSGANITSTFVSGTDIRGEWVQLYYDKGFVANSITISGVAANSASCPKDFIVAGSKEGSNWILLSSQVGILSSAYSPSNTYSIYNFTSYNFYRLIVTKTISAVNLNIADVSLGGNPNTSFIPLDNYNILLYNTNEKQFPPRVWDVAPTAEALSSNEIFNIAPASYYRQQFSLNNHGTYVIYSSSTNATANLGKNLLFDYDLSSSSAGGHWLDSNYIITLGNYLPSGTSRIGTNTYYGDWIIIKLPFQILLTRFRFYSRTNAHARAPGLWRCYGSNDGVNWIEITDASNSITKLSTSDYTANTGNYYEKIVLNLDIPYLYIGWVINNLTGGDNTASILNFVEIQIFGKDDISNSYLNVWNKSNTSIFNTLGNVGIGTTNPIQRLSVVGNSYFNGNVGIGTTNPGTNLLQVGSGGRLKIGVGSTDYSLIGTTDVDGTDNTRIVISGNTRGSFAGRIEYISTAGDHIFYTTTATTERMRILNNGNVGIGITDPATSLHIRHASNPKIFLTSDAGGTRCFLSGNTLGLDLGNDLGSGKIIRFMPDNIERMRISSTGNLGIGTDNPGSRLTVAGDANISGTLTLSSSNMLIQNFLFNSTGTTHASLTNFNSFTSFGYRFIYSPTSNGPGTPITVDQYYSWYIGLGSEYGASGDGSYGAQFAIPRNIANPTMSIRYREGNSWQAWSAITAGFLRGNADFNSNAWQTSTDARQRIYFENVSTTFIKGHGATPLIFRNSADSNIITVLNNGSVGIGIAVNNPQDVAEFYHANSNAAFIRISGGGGTGNTCGINFKNTISRNNGVTTPPSASIWAIDDGNSSSHLAFGTAPTGAATTVAERMRILNNGNIGIGTTNPAAPLHVVGNIFATGDVAAYYSDIRLKNVISNINNPINIINSLNGFYYRPNDLAISLGYSNIKQEIGLSAQDVKNVLPEIVDLAPFDVTTNENGEIISKSGDNYLTLNYQRLVPVLIEGTKDLYKLIQQLQQQVAELTNKISILEAK